MKRQENRAVLAWRGAVSAGLDSSADRAYMKAPVPRSTLQLVDKVPRSCGHTPGKVAGQREANLRLSRLDSPLAKTAGIVFVF